jgi:L-fuculose-phosphate aldolase
MNEEIFPMTQPIWQIKNEMCEIGRRIWLKGFCAGNEGNHSVRIGDNRFLCTPTGVSKGFIKPEEICLIDSHANLLEPSGGHRPSSEMKLHMAIYKARPDVNAVLHSHPPHATAFAIAGIPVPEGIHPEAEVFLGKVKTAKYATPSTHALPESIIPLIEAQTNTILLANHGSVSFSTSLIDAYYKLEILDAYCRILLLTKQIGKVNILDRQQMSELLQVKQQFGFEDPRLACVTEGCVGEENDAFLTQFDVRPHTAVCQCNGGPVTDRVGTSVSQTQTDASAFEVMVQAITDQIMTAAKR